MALDYTLDSGLLALADFTVVAGLEGPQVIISWSPPSDGVDRVMLRRKEREYPRDLEDGTLVEDLTEGLAEDRVVVDLGADLLDEDAAPGASRWWYYKAFVVPTAPPLDEQFGGDAVQVVEQADILRVDQDPIDVQAFRNLRFTFENGDAASANLWIETAPTVDGPWVQVHTGVVLAGETYEQEFTDVAWKYVRTAYDGRDGIITLIVQRPVVWYSSDALSKLVLVYKTGRHIDVVWNERHVPQTTMALDSQQTLAYLTETDPEDGEAFLLEKDAQPHGPLYRFLALLLLEADRAQAYVEAIRTFNSSLDDMPPDVLQHVAVELGLPGVEIGRPLEDVREELFRLAGTWKRRGTSELMSQAVIAEFNIVPRIQEGPGLILRAADPDLWDR